MTSVPDWTANVTAADYEALPEEVCRVIEIVDSTVVVRPGPRRAHQHIAHNLVAALKRACGPALTAVGSADLRLRDVPLLNRRPDAVVYDASLREDVVLRPEHCVLVVEIMSLGSVTTDQLDKPAEYAAAGIEHFWRVEYDEHGVDEDPGQEITVHRFRLDPATRWYATAGVDTGTLSVEDPVRLTVDLAELAGLH